MNHFRKVSHPCLTTRGFTALRCPFGATLSLVRHGLASFGLQTFLRTKTVNKKVSTFKGALTLRPSQTHIAPAKRVKDCHLNAIGNALALTHKGLAFAIVWRVK